MNIGFVSDSFPMGGIAKVVTEIGTIIEDDFCSYYLSASGNSSNYYGIPSSKLIIPKREIRESGFKKNKNKIKKFLEMKFHNNEVDLSNYLKAQQKNIEQFINNKNIDYLVICRYDLSFLVLKLKIKFPKLKIIVWIHGPVELYTKKKERKKYLSYYCKNLLECDEVICLTKFDLYELERLGISGRKIYNPVSYQNREQTEILKREKFVLCVSRLDIYDKGIDSLIKLADELPDEWVLKLVGTGDDAQLMQLDNLIAKMKNRNKLLFVGPKDTDELAEIYQKSSIFISPALYEGFGLTLVEAMSYGLPIVTFETSGAREITEGGIFGILVKDFSVEKIITECLKLIKNENDLQKYSELSYLRSQSFNIENIKKQWLDFLKV